MAELKDCTTNFYPELCGVNVVVNPQAELGTDDDCVLIIGQVGVGGTATPGLYPYSDATASTLFGADGTLMQSIEEFKEGCPTAEIMVYAAADPGGNTGSADIEFAGVATATASGTQYLWVNGQVYSATFDPATETDADLAAKFQAIIAADNPYLTATVAAGVLTVETSETGEIAGFIDVRTSYGCRPDLVSSPEIAVTTTVTPGTGTPDLSGLASVAHGCEFVENPYTDATSMGHVSSYLCGQWSGGANSRGYGVFYGDAAAAAAVGLATNNALFSYMAVDGALTPPYLESAAYACVAYENLNCQATDIAASLSGKVMPSMLAPEVSDRYTPAEQATLVENGMGYFNVTRAKDVVIGRAVTTYTVRDNGSLDVSLRDVNKPAIIACVSRYIRENMVSRFTGYSFRRDGKVGSGNQKVATIAGIRNYLITLAQDLCDRNLIQDIQSFIDTLVIEIDDSTGCISIQMNPELVCALCCINVLMNTI